MEKKDATAGVQKLQCRLVGVSQKEIVPVGRVRKEVSLVGEGIEY